MPEKEVSVSFPLGARPAPIWGGIRPRTGEFITMGSGHRAHMRTEGPCRWGVVWFPAQELANYFNEMTERTLAISPFVQLWRPPAAVGRQFLHFHAAAIRAAEFRPSNIVSGEAAHGMEQQLIHTVVECLSRGLLDGEKPAKRQYPGMMARLEEVLQARQEHQLRVDDLGVAIGVSDRLLRLRCREELGMSPQRYVRFRALHRVHDLLRSLDAGADSLSQIAHRQGFHQLGRFAAHYRTLFGELPSVTLRRSRDRSSILGSPRA